MAAAEGLHRNINSLTFTDGEIRRIAANAATEANKAMAALAKKGTTSAAVRSAQIAMAKVSTQMWANVLDATKVGIGDAVWNATEMQALFDEQLFESVGFSSTYWRASMIAQAKEGVDSLISRKENGITLSQKVYKNAALSAGKIDNIINSALALGKSQRELAKDVIGFIDPAVPGGASYAAQRLARTEINNAFHTTNIRTYKETPWVEAVQWNLSGSHPRPDTCNEYAESTHMKGGDPGVYRPDDVPSRPHPNCLCYIEPVTMDLDKYVKAFKSGKYDDYINNQMGCSRVA